MASCGKLFRLSFWQFCDRDANGAKNQSKAMAELFRNRQVARLIERSLKSLPALAANPFANLRRLIVGRSAKLACSFGVKKAGRGSCKISRLPIVLLVTRITDYRLDDWVSCERGGLRAARIADRSFWFRVCESRRAASRTTCLTVAQFSWSVFLAAREYLTLSILRAESGWKFCMETLHWI